MAMHSFPLCLAVSLSWTPPAPRTRSYRRSSLPPIAGAPSFQRNSDKGLIPGMACARIGPGGVHTTATGRTIVVTSLPLAALPASAGRYLAAASVSGSRVGCLAWLRAPLLLFYCPARRSQRICLHTPQIQRASIHRDRFWHSSQAKLSRNDDSLRCIWLR
ncbi:hypothetical protein GGR50DRAFT_413211 [Xylaria sp. CBS 124048]|nr:hypothetical protein GGR50DRAFT_413211 [Xylaria sp. CBS 124048]